MRSELHQKATGYTFEDAQRTLDEAREMGCINPLLDMTGMCGILHSRMVSY
jgi:hypothetical protein